MNKIVLVALAAIFAVGAWLITAPFVLHYQPAGAPWAATSRLDVETRALLAVAAFAGFLTALAGRVRELYAQGATNERGGLQ